MSNKINHRALIKAVTTTKKRRSAVGRVLRSFLLLGLAAIVSIAALGLYFYIIMTRPGPLDSEKTYEIDKTLPSLEIGNKLEEQGIISDARSFTIIAYLSGWRHRFKAGEYKFPAHVSMAEIMDLLMRGKFTLHKVTIPEGWTSQMAMNRLRENPDLSGDITREALEGGLMPDTYLFKRGTDRQQLIEQMEQAHQKLLEEIWQKRSADNILKSKEDALILASIVEKETGIAQERPEVAAVFLNRLRKNMRLQSDPTVIYGIAGGKGRLDRKLTRNDLVQPSPYNTYSIKGLPPGPIANPGRAALEAVVNPPVSKNFYFVANGKGGHIFAEDLFNHNTNVVKWRELQRKNQAAERPKSETALESDTESQVAPEKTAILPPKHDQANSSAMQQNWNVGDDQSASIEIEPTSIDRDLNNATRLLASKEFFSNTTTAVPASSTPSTISDDAKFQPGMVILLHGKLIAIPKINPRRAL